ISQFQLGTLGFLAYEFGPTLAGPKYYGAMRITIDNTGSAVISDWRYEDTPGMAIVIPEPSRLSLLLVGLIGLASRRRRS
ncbi:MAG: PEP-CTERM sorting domain-containing protein, partial [Verrucomicrobia bacterium]|nr:PEP-CTERM sorting domain-containing protein [Verrucomicrobiota bacterium]